MKDLLVYIDPGYLNEGGHYQNFSQNIHIYCENHNIDLKHFVGRDIADQHMTSLFEYKGYVLSTRKVSYDSREVKAFTKHIETIFKGIKRISYRYRTIIFYMYTAHPYHLQILAELSKKYSISNSRVHAVLFYLDNNMIAGKPSKEYLDILKNTNRAIDKNESFFLHMDSHLSINIYQPYFTKQITLLPFPLFSEKQMKELNYTPRSQKNREKTHIGYCGYLTHKHGFEKIFELIKRLSPNQYKFSLKINLDMQKEQDLLWKLDALKPLSQVSLITEYTKNYIDMIKDCDYMLIPYSEAHYPVQTSGVFIDSVALNKHLLVTADTWMGYWVKELKMGDTFDDIEDLVYKIKNPSKMKADEKKRRIFIKNFSTEKLIQKLFKRY